MLVSRAIRTRVDHVSGQQGQAIKNSAQVAGFAVTVDGPETDVALDGPNSCLIVKIALMHMAMDQLRSTGAWQYIMYVMDSLSRDRNQRRFVTG
jgi:hypothetical protein